MMRLWWFCLALDWTEALLLATRWTASALVTKPTSPSNAVGWSRTRTCTRSSSSSSSRRPSTCLFGSSGGGGGGGGALGKPSYSNDAFYDWHMKVQNQKIRDYIAMDTYVDTDKLWNLAWHDSFVRNGLSDFVPPLTDTLNVLVVGEDDDETLLASRSSSSSSTSSTQSSASSSTTTTTSEEMASSTVDEPEVIQEGAESETTSSSSPQGEALVTKTPAESSPLQDSSCSFLAAVLNDDNVGEEESTTSTTSSSASALGHATYDCIMDRGLMANLKTIHLSSTNVEQQLEDMGRLLLEVTKRIREHGVYIVQTKGPMDTTTKTYLEMMGELLGLQWQFELDGISDDTVSVNVARRYFKEELPSVGKLAKVVEP